MMVKKYQFKLNDIFSFLHGVEILGQKGSVIDFLLKSANVSLESKLRMAFEQYVDYVMSKNKPPVEFKKVSKIKFIYADFSNYKSPLPLHFIGFNQIQFEKLEQLINVRRGFFLIIGKPLTGKTTTALSFVDEIRKKSKKELKIFTALKNNRCAIEGAVSVELFDEPYSKVVQKICFHKPDILLVDDIENAKAGFIIRKALKKDIMIVAVHCAEDVTSALIKLQSFGISKSVLNKNLNAIIFQDLNYFEGETNLLADLVIPDKNKKFEHFNNYMDVTVKGLNLLKKKIPVIEVQKKIESEVR